MIEEGTKVADIAKSLNISRSTVIYWTNKDYRAKSIQRNIKRFKSLPEAQRQAYNASRREYNREYQRRKYKTDPEFRKRQIERAKKYKRSKK